MSLINKSTLAQRLSPPLDGALAEQLLDEFISLERRYILRDWEPAELDAGQFCEIVGRLLYHQDSGNLDRGRDFGECQRYIHNDEVPHALDRDATKMIVMVANVVHKFRSKRGAVHISPTYQANHMDSRYMIEAVRWITTEVLRVFWTADRDSVAAAIRELLRFEVPAIGRFGDVILVQRTDLRADEEILILLHYAGENGFSRKELGQFAALSPSAVTKGIAALGSPAFRQVIHIDGRYVLTDLGHKRIRESLAEKLLLE